MSQDRQTALMLHAVSPDDRRWVMDQLPVPARRELAALLDELTALGIPAEPLPPLDSVAPGTAPARPGDALRGAPLARVRALLDSEPPWLVATVLAMDAWPWRGAYLHGQPEGRRAACRGDGPPALGPRLAEALLAALEGKLAALPATPAAPPPLRERLAGWLRGWTGRHAWPR
ncbi:hypothetical protein [Massilia endophytica]|uniref:hypothetical protein n=1 Tax=Massilia endophytica TaxID=2899220 RepID=UPI001E62B22A|nr:hypothetical protein [Massilia endophytica]UGQ47968.1 hypothetical protein LSQ66_05745 [Massilia endophytica]